jgi:hypothetical protein
LFLQREIPEIPGDPGLSTLASAMNSCAEFCSPDTAAGIFAHGPDGLMVPKQTGLPDGWEVHKEVLPDGRVLNVAIESASSDPCRLRQAETELVDGSEDEDMDDEDRKFFEAYRHKLMSEGKGCARFGTVVQLRFVEYEPEVLNKSRGEPTLWIVVHLFKEGHAGCQSVSGSREIWPPRLSWRARSSLSAAFSHICVE